MVIDAKINKENYNVIDFSEKYMDLPDVKNTNKTEAVSNWLIKIIEEGLNNGKIKVNDLLPSKQEIAYSLGVSIGTVQNAIRQVEDLGYLKSKQCVGTLIKDRSIDNSQIRKLTSKRDMTVEIIKKYITDNKLEVGSALPSIRTLADFAKVSLNTIRLALNVIASSGIATYNDKHKLTLTSLDFCPHEKNPQTLVLKVKEDLINYIKDEVKTGQKILPHEELAIRYNVSVKTIHDAVKSLCDDGILISRRGRYGTTVVRIPDSNTIEVKPEVSIFATASETAFYFYEKTQNKIRKMIAENYEIGSKLPSINALSHSMNLSPNIIRKALNNLANEGYLQFSRGRYGGTYVIDIPQSEEKPYKWIAVNTDAVR